MAKVDNTQELGGFEAISNFLVGRGPEGGIGPQGGDIESQDPPMVDPKIITGKDQPVEEEEELGEDGEGKHIEDFKKPDEKKVEETEEDDPIEEDDKEDKGDEPELQEFEKDIVTFLNEEFGKKLGWEIEGEDAPASIEEFIDFMNTVVEESSKPSYASEDIEALDNFVKNGGSLKDFYANQVDSKIDLENADLEDSFTQKQVIKENFKNLGYKEDKIDKMIKRYEEAGVLEDEAADALELLKEHNEKSKQKLLEQQENFAKVQQEQQQKFVDNVQSSIKEIDSILDVKISDKEKKELESYILVPDKDGLTQFQKEMLGDIKKFVGSAYYTKTGGSLLERKQKQGETNAVKNLHKKLNSNKGNPSRKGSGQSSGEASEGLSLLSSMLRS